MTPFVLDTNFFVEAQRSHYPLDVATSYWDKVKELSHTGKIISIDKVQKELYKSHGQLRLWCEQNLPLDFFHDSKGVTNEYGRAMAWANSQHFLYQALSDFSHTDNADPWLASFCLCRNLHLVTYEVSDLKCRTIVKLPDVCNALNVSWHRPITMFRKLSETF